MKKSALMVIAVAVAAVPLVVGAAPEPGSTKITPPKPIACTHSDSMKAAAGETDVKATAEAAAPGDVYMLPTDPVTGETLPAEPAIISHEGRELRFATKTNAELFAKEPAKYLEKVDAAITAEQLPFYPLETCVVSGEKLSAGDMGPPVNFVYNNRLVRLCCGGCIARLRKDPAKYLAALDEAAIKAQSEKYPLKNCLVTDEDLSAKEKPYVFVVGNRMVKLCCKHCLTTFNTNPAGYLSMIKS